MKILINTLAKTGIILALFTFSIVSFGQSSVLTVSGNKYDVHIRLTPKTIVVPASCENGYNYNVGIEYEISFSGNVPRDPLHTLQGYLDCGSNKNNFFNLPLTADTGNTVTVGNPYRSQSDCDVATTSLLQCNHITIEINGKGMPNQKISYNAVTLPVELTRFTADEAHGVVDLAWETASEKNNEYFAVERSTDGNNWETIGKVTGMGNSMSMTQYNFTDYTPQSGVSYYRLKQNDFDGEFEYSEILVVKMGIQADEDVKIYPNPTTDKVFVTGVAEQPVVKTISGKNVSHLANMVDNGQNQYVLDFTGLSRGVYFIQTSTGTYRIYKR